MQRLRRGISVIEVLFSIGIVAIGLLGVLALMPVALDQVGKGNNADRVARLGQNGEEEFFSRDMFRTNQWAQPLARPPASLTQFHWGAAVPPGGIYCIDPQFVVANVDQVAVPANPPPGSPPNFTYSLNPAAFPYSVDTAGGYPLVQRVSLRTAPWPPVSPPVPARFDILRMPVADQFFTLDDELAIVPPDEKTLPPEQEFGVGAKRLSEGTFSWFATLAPVTTMVGTVADSYYLSIVVVHRRNKRFPLTQYDETLATIPDANFHASGYRGGDVTLVAGLAEELDVKTGQWVMLMRNWGTSQWVRWYRVMGADPAPRQNGAQWELDVSLEGPDWPVVAAVPQPMTRVAIVRGVSEVFERTVRLE